MPHGKNGPKESLSHNPENTNKIVAFGPSPESVSNLSNLPEYKNTVSKRLSGSDSEPDMANTEDSVFSHGCESSADSKGKILHIRPPLKPEPNLSRIEKPLPGLGEAWEDFMSDNEEFIQRLKERNTRNTERSVLWHLLYTLSEGYRSMPLASLLLPDEYKKGSASAQALVEYARHTGHSIRPLSRLAKIAIRLTRHRRPKEVRDAIRDVTEMGHSMQVQCLTRAAFNHHELEDAMSSRGTS